MKKKSKAVMLSKRAYVYVLERCRVVKQDERVVYLTESGSDIEKFFNIPEKNTAFLLLGTGTSITSAAVRKLAESQVVVGFSGGGGSPNFANVDIAFLNCESEYRPTEYMQAWAKMWFDEKARLSVCKEFVYKRIDWIQYLWKKFYSLEVPLGAINELKSRTESARKANDILMAEAQWAKHLYGVLARKYKVSGFVRESGNDDSEIIKRRVNDLLDHGNYIAYGYSACTLNAMGIQFSFPIMHGKTRRGALVFDVADLFKDGMVMPLAFEYGSGLKDNQDFRVELINRCFDERLLDQLFGFVKELCQKSTEKQ